MSVFTDQSPTKGEGQNDTTQGQNTTDDWVSKVVAEKGEHWSDPQTIAKGYAHAQERIKELEELANKAKEQDYAKQLLDRLQEQASVPAAEVKSGSEEEKTTLKSEDIESLINQTLSKREQDNTVKQNLIRADKLLEEAFGTDAGKAVDTKAKELGISKERLKEIAGESPTAFMQLMGNAPRKETNSNIEGKINTTGFESKSNTERTSEYYRKLRKENRNLYYHPNTQRQMIEDKMRLGDKF